MKKGIKTFCKVLSVFLAVLFVIEILPLQVMAEEFTDAVAQKEFIEDLVNNPTDAEKDAEAEILYEVEEKRGEHTKVYKKSDGTYTAVMTEEPLHYLDEGEWKEIDNSMILNGNIYTNLNNLFNVELPKNIDENKELTVEKDGYELSFSVNDIENSSAVVENNIAASDTEIESADKAISQTQSLITYSDIAENTNLQYVITPNSIKENIIVSNKESVKDKYTFIFETNGLNAEKQNDGSIRFKDNNGNVKFTIPRPVMTDANFALSYDIGVSMKENTDSTITLEYLPSIDWTSSSDRVYPVFIDPAIIVDNQDVSWAEDVCVIDDSTNETDQDRNFYNDFLGMVVNTSIIDDGVEKSADAEIHTKINTEQLKSLGNNVIITEAQYLLAGASMNGRALAKEIAKPVDLTTVTYSTKPDLETEAFDYYTSPYVTDDDTNLVYAHFNITKPLNEWLSGEENNGFAIVAGDDNFYGLFYMNGVYSYTNPSTNVTTTKTYSTAMCFDYVDMGGYNENLNYHSQSAGRAGTGYVNDFTQQLSVIRNDINMTDNNFPVTIGMIYDTATYDKLELLNYDNMIAYGNNWVPNYLRAYLVDDENQLTYYTATGASIDFTRSISENGEVIYTESYSDIYGNHNYEIEATETEVEYITVTRPDGYIESFNNNGLLTCVTNPGDSSKSISIVYDSMFRIDYIIDSVGRKYDYIYCSKTNLLSKIRCCTTDCKHLITECTHTTDDCTSEISNCTPITDGSTTAILEVRYTYDENNNLETVTYPDGESVKYEYDNNGNMISMTNIDDYRIAYEYEVKDNDEDVIEYTDKVTSVTEQAKNGTTYVNGNSITYERLNSNQVKLTDATGDYEIYHFGNYGNLLYTIDNNGNYVMHEDVDSTDETHYASVSDYRSLSENLLSNTSFEETDSVDGSLKNWDISETSIMQSNDVHALFGTKVLKISSDGSESANVKQSVDVISGGDYTFSAYVYTEESALPINLYLHYNDMPETGVTTSVTTTNGKWERVFVTICDVPNDVNKITVVLEAEANGVFYVDGVQLEQASTASLYNYISNGSFNIKNDGNDNYSLEPWTGLSNAKFCPENINGKTVNALILPGEENETTETSQTNATDGEENETTEISQTIAIDGKKNDIIRVGGWFKGHFINSFTNNVWLKSIIEESEDPKICNFTNDRYAYIEVKCENTTTNATQTTKIPFNENLSNWQFVAREFSLDGIYDQATITVYYSKNLNSALLSNIELTKTKIRTTSVENGEIQCPCANCAVINCSCNCERELYCYCSQCLESKNARNRQDSFGEIALGNNYDEIAVVQLLTQRIGDNVTSNFNLSNGLLKDFYDAVENHSTYTYDSSGVLKEISYTNDDGNKEILVLYEYDNDKLEFIIRNDFAYGFSYDCWGQLVSISVGETFINENNKREFISGRATPIVSYEYDKDEYRDRIISLTYHNDDTEIYDYSESVTVNLGYDVQTNDINSIFINGDDRTDILHAEVNDIYTAETDANNNLIETIDGATFETELIKLKAENGIYYETKRVTSNKQNSIIAGTELDINGRYLNKTTVVDNSNNQNAKKYVVVYDRYRYLDTATSNQKLEYTNTVFYDNIIDENASWNTNCLSEYEYDDNNNVVTESIYNYIDSDQKQLISYTNYEYTEFNQLKRVNQLINNSPQDEKSITYFYTYDKSGNITSKVEYPYTTSEEITSKPNSVINYQYNIDNSIWKDRLDSTIDSNGTLTTIEYDNIGNPLTIGNSHFTWSGHLLQTYENKDTGKFIEYEYDKNGLCNKKTVYENNAIIETHDYIWSEGKLVSQIYTDSTFAKYVIKYVYDLYNTPYGFILCYSEIQENGESKNIEERYLFRRNMKNDIIAIVNEFGNDIINYEYNVWGTTESFISNSDADNVLKNIEGSLALRYRGYCYDNHTGLYYIQGRYYSPELCRFINADNTSNLGSTETALSYNLYTYCENNPVMYVVDNKDTGFSNTINSNYIYNKRISQNFSGFIDDQKNGIASKLRYGINTISPVGCGCVATYNALLMLGNPIEICDIIREFETSKLLYYGLYGTHVGNIGKFLSTKGYNVTVTFANSDNVDDNIVAFDTVAQDENVKANILLYRNNSVSHFIAIKYDSTIGDYIAYNAPTKRQSDIGSIKKFIPTNCEPMALISISSE